MRDDMSSKKLDVVMTAYNNAPYIAQAIESILQQSFGDFRFIIINDGSRDATGDIINAYAARDSRIYALHQDNQGTIGAANRGLSCADADIIARMDGDDIALPERFARQIAFLNANPAVGALGTWISVIDEQGAVRGGGGDVPVHHEDLVANLRHSTPIMNPTAMIRKSVADQLGGYRAAYKHCEDYDFWLRCSEITRLANVPEKLLYYRYYDGQVSRKYAVQQRVGTIIAHTAYERRRASLTDPTDALATMPGLDELARIFDDADMPHNIRRFVLADMDYNIAAYQHGATEMLVDAIRNDDFPRYRRPLKIAARLLRDGQIKNAFHITRAVLLKI